MKYNEWKYGLEEKQCAKDVNHYQQGKLKIYAPDDSDLHEIMLNCVRTMDHNGGWDFELKHLDDEKAVIIYFKWNGGVRLADALGRQPKFSCEHRKQLLF